MNKEGKKTNPLNQSDLDCISSAAEGIRLAGRIVDTPCNEMHTDTFIRVYIYIHIYIIIMFIIFYSSKMYGK